MSGELITTEAFYDIIDQEVAKQCNVPVERLYEKTRIRPIADARFICMSIIKEFFNPPLKVIGERYGRKDHTSVINALGKTKTYKESIPEFSIKFQNSRDSVRSQLGDKNNKRLEQNIINFMW